MLHITFCLPFALLRGIVGPRLFKEAEDYPRVAFTIKTAQKTANVQHTQNAEVDFQMFNGMI